MTRIDYEQLDTWFEDHCEITDGTLTWNEQWATIGLNDTDPPDPPSPPVSPYLEKSLWIDYIVNHFDGYVPPGWPT